MSYKFTRKEFNDIVESQEEYYSNSIFFRGCHQSTDKYTNGFNEALEAINPGLSNFLDNIVDDNIYNKVLALANPYTRDLVKGDLVEAEEKFLFTKIQEIDGETLNLNMVDNENGDNHIYLDSYDPTPLTIQQVEDYGFNLDKFEKIPYEYITLEVKDNPYF